MRNVLTRSLTLAALTGTVLALGGCPSRDVSAVDPTQSKVQTTEVPISVNRDIDILWVIDNSGSMGQEQSSLATNFPRFIEVLDGIEGGRPNLHMAIVSSDVGTGQYPSPGNPGDPNYCGGDGDNGVFQLGSSDSACPALNDSSRYISDVSDGNGGRITNYTGNLQDQFSCMAQLGTGGCGFEQHLESMRRGLMNTSENNGFLRPSAYLAVITIQDEDDGSAKDDKIFDNSDSSFGQYSSFRQFEYGDECDDQANIRQLGAKTNCHPQTGSQYIEDPKVYADFLKGLKDDPSKVIVATIAGPATPDVVEQQPYGNTDQIWIAPSCVVCQDGSTTPDDNTCNLSPHPDQVPGKTIALTAAAPAIRMQSFIDEFPARGTFQTICNYNPQLGTVDMTPALQQIASLLKKVIGSPCVEGNLALDADGQPDCDVADVENYKTDNEVQHPLEECDASLSNTPCFHFVSNPDKCNSATEPTHLELTVERGGTPTARQQHRGGPLPGAVTP